ncbi:hypothetical protein [Undibacterium curvum]|uniref:4Fe-4S ferredoxin-type domain-containing protein n=1 Tax=Undibacterium curvum TaxID=2762294 RepID=A0ABR7A8N2_9BURK|nr:hypothetical protein [Undibacterium curvum]MBC3933217.1 hypothetical protein [Undibacterium curvum]
MKAERTSARLIWIHPEAPAKPAEGLPCNGCGICCAAEPCPVAQFFLWQFSGSCRALQWSEQDGCYRCGMLIQPSAYWRWLPRSWDAWFARRVRRWIAAGTACDSNAWLEPAPSAAERGTDSTECSGRAD